jgi:hypothetical protein
MSRCRFGFRTLIVIPALAWGLAAWGCREPSPVAPQAAPSEPGSRPPVTADPASGGGLEKMGAGTNGESNGGAVAPASAGHDSGP